MDPAMVPTGVSILDTVLQTKTPPPSIHSNYLSPRSHHRLGGWSNRAEAVRTLIIISSTMDHVENHYNISRSSNLPLPTSNGGPYSGDLTYYDPGLGSCGITSTGSEPICAVSHVIFDAASTSANPNENPLCGLKVRIRRGETSVDVKVVDRCLSPHVLLLASSGLFTDRL